MIPERYSYGSVIMGYEKASLLHKPILLMSLLSQLMHDNKCNIFSKSTGSTEVKNSMTRKDSFMKIKVSSA